MEKLADFWEEADEVFRRRASRMKLEEVSRTRARQKTNTHQCTRGVQYSLKLYTGLSTQQCLWYRTIGELSNAGFARHTNILDNQPSERVR